MRLCELVPPEVPLRSDPELVAKSVGGDADAFTELLRRHDRHMRGVVWRLVGSAGAMDDVLQDAYLKAWRGIGSFRGDAAFSSWLYRIAYTTALDHIKATGRRATRHKELEDRIVADPAIAVAQSAAVMQALAALPADQCAVVTLVDGQGATYDEVAEFLGISAGTVASRLHRARRALRAELGEQGEDR